MATIRELKKEAYNFNKTHNALISKAKFGKCVSRMTKNELIFALSWAKSIIQHRYGRWERSQTGRVGFTYLNGKIHTTYVGFDSHLEAKKFLQYGYSKNAFEAAIIRRSKHLKDCKYEIKIWCIKPNFLITVLKKNLPEYNVKFGVGSHSQGVADIYARARIIKIKDFVANCL